MIETTSYLVYELYLWMFNILWRWHVLDYVVPYWPIGQEQEASSGTKTSRNQSNYLNLILPSILLFYLLLGEVRKVLKWKLIRTLYVLKDRHLNSTQCKDRSTMVNQMDELDNGKAYFNSYHDSKSCQNHRTLPSHCLKATTHAQSGAINCIWFRVLQTSLLYCWSAYLY